MAFNLNVYSSFIDTTSDAGIKLMNNAIHQFKSPLIGTLKLAACDAAKIIKAVSGLSNQYGYDFLIQNTPTSRTLVAGANPNDPDVITLGDNINLLETFSDSNIDAAKKYASTIWGDMSFDASSPMTIRVLEEARDEITTHTIPRLTSNGKDIMRDRTHSKILAHQIMAILDEDGQRTLLLEKEQFTWKSSDRRNTEFDGLVMLAILLSRVKPHYQVDMWQELKKSKELTLKQFGNNVVQYLDEMKIMKMSIDEKDIGAYTDNAYVKDIFAQLKLAPVDSFSQEYERLESRWLLGKELVNSESLRRESIMHYTQLDNDGKWAGQYSAKDQIVILTTKVTEQTSQMLAMTTELNSMKSGTGYQKQSSTFQKGENRIGVDEWRLTKVENGKEFGAIEFNGKTWYFCEDGHSHNNKECGMYCLHKPGEGHQDWLKAKIARKAREKIRRGKKDKEGAPEPSPSVAGGVKRKLELSEHLQAALATSCGISDETFQELWNDSCAETGN